MTKARLLSPRPGRLLVLAAVCLAQAAAPRAQTVSEAALKAAFLYNFVKFTEWPATAAPPAAPLVLCVADNAVSDALQTTVAGRSVGEHALVVARVALEDPLKGCALLYAGALDAKRAAQVISALRGGNVLSISDFDRFIEAGGVVRLYLDGGRMRFTINTDAAERARLRLSSQLLSLATIVKDGADREHTH